MGHGGSGVVYLCSCAEIKRQFIMKYFENQEILDKELENLELIRQSTRRVDLVIRNIGVSLRRTFSEWMVNADIEDDYHSFMKICHVSIIARSYPRLKLIGSFNYPAIVRYCSVESWKRLEEKIDSGKSIELVNSTTDKVLKLLGEHEKAYNLLYFNGRNFICANFQRHRIFK